MGAANMTGGLATMHIGVIGAGHAGVEAARAAAEGGARVSLFSAEDCHPYYRPRLVALAFGQAEFEAIQMHPETWYGEHGIEIRRACAVESIDAGAKRVTAGGETFGFDGIVVACGSLPVVPPFAAGQESVLPLWSKADAVRIRAKVERGAHVIVLGGGILGIEAALRALDAGMSVEIVEKMTWLMPAQFCERASKVIESSLREKGIGVHLGRTVMAAEGGRGGQPVRLTLDDGQVREGKFCMLSIGARPRTTLAAGSGLAVERGVRVDASLQTSGAGVYAAGDVIQVGGVTRCSVRESTAQGRVAGANVVAHLAGRPSTEYSPSAAPLMFKSGDFEIYSAGEPGGEGRVEVVLEGSTDRVLRLLVMKDGRQVGVQMIGTREGLDDYVRLLAAPL